jgi:hypothetical protein
VKREVLSVGGKGVESLSDIAVRRRRKVIVGQVPRRVVSRFTSLA